MKTSTYHPSATLAPTHSQHNAWLWRVVRDNSLIRVSVWLCLHIMLALVFANSPLAATVHSVLVVLVGLWCAVSLKLETVVYVCAYLVGSEVIWRMVNGMLFYEYGKYGLSLILLIAILRFHLFRGPALAICYFIFLLPSIVLPSAFASDTTLRQQVSFNLSGPLALALSVWVLSQVTFIPKNLAPLLLSLLGPTVTIACVAAYRLSTTPDVYFGKSSNFAASGGFGPNQVSALLGLGILAALLLALLLNYGRLLKFLLVIVMIALAAQASLTFSRTGLYLAGLSVLVAMFCLLSNWKTRLQLIGLTAVLLVVGIFFVLPRLNAYTNGALRERFLNTDVTNRDVLFLADLQIWAENPVFGVGPGLGAAQRLSASKDTASTSHTEYTRLLAEHGLFGLAALAILLILCAINLRRPRTPEARAITWSLLCWAMLFMLVSAMRLAAPAFLLGLSAVTWAVVPFARNSSTPSSAE